MFWSQQVKFRPLLVQILAARWPCILLQRHILWLCGLLLLLGSRILDTTVVHFYGLVSQYVFLILVLYSIVLAHRRENRVFGAGLVSWISHCLTSGARPRQPSLITAYSHIKCQMRRMESRCCLYILSLRT